MIRTVSSSGGRRMGYPWASWIRYRGLPTSSPRSPSLQRRRRLLTVSSACSLDSLARSIISHGTKSAAISRSFRDLATLPAKVLA